MKLAKLVAPLIASAFIFGCSKGPSESDIKSVMEKNIEEFNSLIPRALGGNMKFEIHEVISHGCKEDKADVYTCDIEVDMTAPVVGRNKDRSNVEFVKRNGEWHTAKAFKP